MKRTGVFKASAKVAARRSKEPRSAMPAGAIASSPAIKSSSACPGLDGVRALRSLPRLRGTQQPGIRQVRRTLRLDLRHRPHMRGPCLASSQALYCPRRHVPPASSMETIPVRPSASHDQFRRSRAASRLRPRWRLLNWAWVNIQPPEHPPGFGPCYHLPELHFGYLFLTHSQLASELGCMASSSRRMRRYFSTIAAPTACMRRASGTFGRGGGELAAGLRRACMVSFAMLVLQNPPGYGSRLKRPTTTRQPVVSH